eukprot:15467426-Alexandrium_andersonii.AAC.1
MVEQHTTGGTQLLATVCARREETPAMGSHEAPRRRARSTGGAESAHGCEATAPPGHLLQRWRNPRVSLEICVPRRTPACNFERPLLSSAGPDPTELQPSTGSDKRLANPLLIYRQLHSAL